MGTALQFCARQLSGVSLSGPTWCTVVLQGMWRLSRLLFEDCAAKQPGVCGGH